MKIAIDVMGAQHGPNVVIEGAKQKISEDPNLEIVLVGQKGVLERYYNYEDGKINIIDAPSVLRSEDGLMDALKKRDSSTHKTVELIKENIADAGVSFTDAAKVMGVVSKYLGLPYIDRHPFAARIESERDMKYTLFLDVGAVREPKPKNLLEFAILAMCFMQAQGIDKPEIGLLSDGTEKEKGDELTRNTRELFYKYKDKNPEFNFIGYVEGWNINLGKKPEIIITGGYVGNIVLKAQEGVYRLLGKDPSKHGGAYILGTKFSKGHAEVDIEGVKATIDKAIETTKYDFSKIERAIKLI